MEMCNLCLAIEKQCGGVSPKEITRSREENSGLRFFCHCVRGLESKSVQIIQMLQSCKAKIILLFC